jgi:hypothetical protein
MIVPLTTKCLKACERFQARHTALATLKLADFLGSNDNLVLGQLALQPLAQGSPEGTVKTLGHDFDHRDTVFLRLCAIPPETLS